MSMELYGRIAWKRDPGCNFECFEVVRHSILGMAPKKLAGVLIEPIQAGGGQLPAPPEWLRMLKKFVKRKMCFSSMMSVRHVLGELDDISQLLRSMKKKWVLIFLQI